jgi:hypothetical protein
MNHVASCIGQFREYTNRHGTGIMNHVASCIGQFRGCTILFSPDVHQISLVYQRRVFTIVYRRGFYLRITIAEQTLKNKNKKPQGTYILNPKWTHNKHRARPGLFNAHKFLKFLKFFSSTFNHFRVFSKKNWTSFREFTSLEKVQNSANKPI